MWKLIKSSYNATRGLVKFLGEGTELLVEGLNECDKGLEALNAKMEKYKGTL
ncbi:hypothetical protein [Desulfobacter latus]|uniref:Uncharacterized protein n=1 Tax=Desulfobacter latus TaxID=2292 RepID=A0A850T463_9BACT|nr:hypothetical protein [Desulfobacter latus]NWH05871.1 hypothetical protein [Desulfobacter latus]